MNYPIELNRWEAVDPKDGKTYYITELQHESGMTTFDFGSIYSDGSGHRWDWAKTYGTARKHLLTSARLKKVKPLRVDASSNEFLDHIACQDGSCMYDDRQLSEIANFIDLYKKEVEELEERLIITGELKWLNERKSHIKK